MAKFVGVERPCEVCGVVFRSPKSQAHVRTCSTECGYKIRKHPNEKPKLKLSCAACGKVFSERQCHAGRRTYCSKSCQNSDPAFLLQLSARTSGEKNAMWKGGVTQSALSKSGKQYIRQTPEKERAKTAMRRANRMQATPAWANGTAIMAIYAEANRLTIETGIVHHVDHIVPLTSNEVCGLHCEANLQVLTGLDNLRKHNRTWPNKP